MFNYTLTVTVPPNCTARFRTNYKAAYHNVVYLRSLEPGWNLAIDNRNNIQPLVEFKNETAKDALILVNSNYYNPEYGQPALNRGHIHKSDLVNCLGTLSYGYDDLPSGNYTNVLIDVEVVRS